MASRNNRLSAAVLDGDMMEVANCIETGADVNHQNNLGQTALHNAARWGETEIAEMLINGGSIVDIQDKTGSTPLHIAANWGYTKITDLLITHDININMQNYKGLTALHKAVRRGQTATANLLITRGAIVDTPTKIGQTPLHMAAAWGYTDIADLLINRGANCNIQDYDGETPLHWAALEGKTDITYLLINCGAVVNIQDNKGQTPLHLVVQNNLAELTYLLITHGANLDIQDVMGQTPLHLTLDKYRNNTAAGLLLQHGASVIIQDNWGQTPLHLAVQDNLTEITNLIIALGTNLNIQENKGRTPLHLAINNNLTEIADQLISRRANIDIQDDMGQTPLHCAAKMNNRKIADLLINCAADVAIQDIMGRTPLHLAVQNNFIELTALLITHGSNLDSNDCNEWTPMHLAVNYNLLDMAELLITYGANLEIKNGKGQTPLQVAVEEDMTQMTDLLVTRGANLDIQDDNGRTPLHLAIKKYSTQITERLITGGANLDIQDREGCTPLHMVTKRGLTAIVRLLIVHGAKIDIKTNDKKKAYDLARTEEIKELFKAVEDLKGLSRELIQLGKKSARVFAELLIKENYELLELRSMLQGEPGTGKSTIARFLVGKGPSKFRRSTNGIDLYIGLSFFDDDKEEWIDGKQDFTMEDITVSRSVKSYPAKKHVIDEPKQINIPSMRNNKKDAEKLPGVGLMGYPGTCLPRKKDNQDTKSDQVIHDKPDGTMDTVVTENPRGIIIKIFGEWKEVKEVKLSVTEKTLYNKSQDVTKKQLHQRKLVPVTIWDFGGQDVFYSTHQTFLTYRAVYMIVLDGSRKMNEPCTYQQFLPGKIGVKTPRDYVRFWINTIITYCKGDIPGFPKIMIILTHKDKLNDSEVDSRRSEIFSEIERMFAGSPIEQHLVIKDRIFVNARNSKDPEMEQIKKSLIHQARIQPTWGQKHPKCFLPLELELQYLVKKGVTLIPMEYLKRLNLQMPVRPLTVPELKVFLKFQHAVGKILYFDEPFLNEHIIIAPTFLIDAFKSIITDYQFCKGDRKKEKAWHSMDKKGILLKQAVEKIWNQRKYAHFYKSKEYLLGVMTHLDILVEPLRYDITHSRKPTEFYYVASMIRKQDTTKYLRSPEFSQRNIALCFDTSSSIIPPALSFRFISYCLSIWGVKTYGDDNEDMLFHRSAVFTIDPSLDMHIQCEDDQLIVRLVHARNRTLIMKDLASSIRECLFAALYKISQLYIKTSSERTENVRSFDVKVCCSSSIEPCSIAIQDLGEVWICKHHIEHGRDLVLSWFTEKEKEKCESFCPVTNTNFLVQKPTDFHLRRLALEYNMNEVREIVTALGFPYQKWDELKNSTNSDESIRFAALQRCFKMTSFTFDDLKNAAEHEVIKTPHTICKVLRDKHIHFDSEPEKWDLSLTDEDIDKLAPVVGASSLAFLVELGFTFEDWERIDYRQTERDLVKLNRNIMEEWRKSCKDRNIRPTLRTIGQAFENIGISTKNIANTLFI